MTALQDFNEDTDTDDDLISDVLPKKKSAKKKV
jgi:hypothetical protein